MKQVQSFKRKRLTNKYTLYVHLFQFLYIYIKLNTLSYYSIHHRVYLIKTNHIIVPNNNTEIQFMEKYNG